MRKNLGVVIILVLLLVGYYFYKQLGGNPELTFTTELKSFTVYGEEFRGRYNDPKVEELFLKARNISDSLDLKLTVVNYGSDEDAREIHQFLGVLSDDRIAIEGYSILIINPVKVVKTTLDSHNSVMPRPEDVRQMASDFAVQQGIDLSGTSIEVYQSERELVIFFPVSEN